MEILSPKEGGCSVRRGLCLTVLWGGHDGKSFCQRKSRFVQNVFCNRLGFTKWQGLPRKQCPCLLCVSQTDCLNLKIHRANSERIRTLRLRRKNRRSRKMNTTERSSLRSPPHTCPNYSNRRNPCALGISRQDAPTLCTCSLSTA